MHWRRAKGILPWGGDGCTCAVRVPASVVPLSATGDNLFLSRAPACDRRRGVIAPYASGGLDIRSRALVQQLDVCAEVLAYMDMRRPPFYHHLYHLHRLHHHLHHIHHLHLHHVLPHVHLYVHLHRLDLPHHPPPGAHLRA